jgi:adenylate cyclase
MISEDTYKQAKDHIEVRELDLLTVVGKEKPVRVYELLCTKGELNEKDRKARDLFEQGLVSYRTQDWDRAMNKFKQVIEVKGEDAPSRAYIGRCEAFKKEPPGKDWDGVYRLKTK